MWLLHERPEASPSEWFGVSGKQHHTADVAAVFKDGTKQKKWYGHGRTGCSGSDAPEILAIIAMRFKLIIHVT